MVYEKAPRSVSQVNTYNRCPQQYYLSRIKKVWQKPAAWLAQGTAVHEAAERYELSGRSMTLTEAEQAFVEAYYREINESAKETPNFSWWFASGPYRGLTDIERREGIGIEQVGRYLAWYEKHPEEQIWSTPGDEGKPAVELGFEMDLGPKDDPIRVRGFIDAVVENTKTGKLVVRDNKTGKSPGDDFQLGVYAVAVAKTLGVDQPTEGDYWMGTSGKPTIPYDLSDWTEDTVTEVFVELEDNLRAERFDPLPDPDKCRFCDVANSCEFAAG